MCSFLMLLLTAHIVYYIYKKLTKIIYWYNQYFNIINLFLWFLKFKSWFEVLNIFFILKCICIWGPNFTFLSKFYYFFMDFSATPVFRSLKGSNSHKLRFERQSPLLLPSNSVPSTFCMSHSQHNTSFSL